MGFRLFADPAHRSETVTAAWLPDGLDWKTFNTALKAQDLVLAGGQGKLAGKVFRVGHLGSVTTGEILEAIATIESVSIDLGLPVTAGSGVAAAERAAAETLHARQVHTAGASGQVTVGAARPG
jgi:alanine-glyoxylate transaminase/serine-glyoxylate transaminase/serine-pyruvate transaminase